MYIEDFFLFIFEIIVRLKCNIFSKELMQNSLKIPYIYALFFSLSFLFFLDIAQSKFLLPVLRKVICFYPLGAFPRRLHSSISVHLVVASRNSVLFPPSSKEESFLFFLLLVPYSRLRHSIAQECIAHAFSLLPLYPRIYILNPTCGHTSTFNSYFTDNRSDLRVGSQLRRDLASEIHQRLRGPSMSRRNTKQSADSVAGS